MSTGNRPEQNRRQEPGFEDMSSYSTSSLPSFGRFMERPSDREPAQRENRDHNSRNRGNKNTRPPDKRGAPKAKGPARNAPPSRERRPSSSRRPESGRPDRPPSKERERSAARGSPGSSRPRPQPQERKRRKRMSVAKRRFLVVLAVLAMLTATGFLAESLLLRVTEVRVAGDEVYAQEDILKVCGFKDGDNLLLIPARDREEKLESQLPYIAKAKITRKIPGTVLIEITAARGACCFQAGGIWYVVAGDGKVLESRPDPPEGLMQVLGITPASAQVGVKLQLEGEETSAVFAELVNTIDRLEATGEFTCMDLSDLYSIRLWYQGRVECQLGSSNQLDYKVQWGYVNLTDEKGIGSEKTGVLDLSYLPTKKRSFFTPGDIATPPGGGTVSAPQDGQATPDPEGNIPGSDTTGDANSDESGGRGGDIPDAPFTG